MEIKDFAYRGRIGEGKLITFLLQVWQKFSVMWVICYWNNVVRDVAYFSSAEVFK